jgi:hypothetical protein
VTLQRAQLDARDLAAQEDEAEDGDDGDQGQDQGVLGEALAGIAREAVNQLAVAIHGMAPN